MEKYLKKTGGHKSASDLADMVDEKRDQLEKGKGKGPNQQPNKKDKGQSVGAFGGNRASSPSPGTSSMKNRVTHKRVSLPHPEQPGGLKDPNRKGLSGSASDRYVRYLREGMGPAEARERAVTGTPSKRTGPTPPRREGGDKKRKVPLFEQRCGNRANAGAAAPPLAQNVEPHRHEPGQKRRTYAKVVSEMSAAIVPSNYPNSRLDENQLTLLQDGILEAIVSIEDSTTEPRFSGIQFKSGYIIVNCDNKETQEWLKKIVPSLKPWEGAELRVATGDEIPKPIVITAFLPMTEDLEKALALIKNQNRNVNTVAWRTIKSIKEGKGLVVIAEVDEESMKFISESSFELNFRFGKIKVTRRKELLEEKPTPTGESAVQEKQVTEEEEALLLEESPVVTEEEMEMEKQIDNEKQMQH